MMATLRRLLSSTRGMIMKELKEALAFRRLWLFAAIQRSNVRFIRTRLGSIWLGLSSVLSIGVLALVYSQVFKVENFNVYIVQLGLGLALWNGLAAPIAGAGTILEKNSSHITSMNLPHIYYFFEEWVFNLLTFIQSFGVVVVFLMAFDNGLGLRMIFPGAICLLNYAWAMLWMPSLICLAGIKRKDFFQLLPTVMQLLFLLTPVLYSKNALGKASIIADLNPIYRFMSPVRQSMMGGGVEWISIAVLLGINAIGSILVVIMLRRYSKVIPFYS